MLSRNIRAMAGLAVALAAARPVAVRADEPAVPAALDEATFLTRVRERSPRWRTLDARRRAARARVGVAAVLPNPTLSYEREAVPGLDASDDFVRLGWVLDLAGRRGLAGAAAGAGAEAERLEIDREAVGLELDARLAYLDAVHARELLARLDAARVPLAELVATLRARSKQGDASSYDADRATLELDALDDDRATANRHLVVSSLRLGTLLGDPGTAYAPGDPLVLPAKRPAREVSRRPDIAAAQARATQAEHELTAARRSWIPRFEIVAGILSSASMGGDGLGYVVGIAGELPLFDAGGAATERSRADVKRWRLEAEAIANEARGDSEQAWRELALRIEQAEAYLAGPATRAADLQRRATVAYREGDRPILELLDVQRGARQAAVRAVELVYEARRAELMLHRALGRTR